MSPISETDLIINPDGTVYHLNLLPEDLAPIVITVGDPERVPQVSKHFDRIELAKGKREFITHTGFIGKKRVTVISTGIGTDNIDIVMNELDALVNIDFNTRLVKNAHTSLNIIRVGTSGSVRSDVQMGSLLASEYGIGLDALMNYYQLPYNTRELEIREALILHFESVGGILPYVASGSTNLIRIIGNGIETGITVTAPGFYAPQGRQVRAQGSVTNLLELFSTFRIGNQRITNLEMETAGIYALARILGHEALSINAILASRVNREFSSDPAAVVDRAITHLLEKVEQL